jgi:hypothetical protein
MKEPCEMDKFELAGLNITKEQKSDIIRICELKGLSVDYVIGLMAHKSLKELAYVKVRYTHDMFMKLIHNIYDKKELYMLTKLINCDIFFIRKL